MVGLNAVSDPEHTCIHGHYYTSVCTRRHENRAMHKPVYRAGIYFMFTVHLYMDKLADLQCKHTKEQLSYIDKHVTHKHAFKLTHVLTIECN